MFRIIDLFLIPLAVSLLIALSPTLIEGSPEGSCAKTGPRRPTRGAFLSFYKKDSDCGWYELRPPCTQYDLDPAWSSVPQKPPRKRIWHGRYDDERTWVPVSAASASMSPHPLRSNEYTLQLRWSGKWDRGLPSRVQIDFDTETGRCRATNKADVLGIGHWQVYPWGLWFTLVDASGAVEYTCTAQLHLNPFGDHSKLLQGSIVRYSISDGLRDLVQDEPWLPNQRKWFRPVVGRFSGRGIGG